MTALLASRSVDVMRPSAQTPAGYSLHAHDRIAGARAALPTYARPPRTQQGMCYMRMTALLASRSVDVMRPAAQTPAGYSLHAHDRIAGAAQRCRHTHGGPEPSRRCATCA